MTRAEELTLKLVDGSIDPNEQQELEWLVASDEQEAARHIMLLDVEALFRGQRQDLDLGDAVMARLFGGHDDDAPVDLEDEPDDSPLAGLEDALNAAPTPRASTKSTPPRGAAPAEPPDPPRRRRRRRNTAPPIMYVILVACIAAVFAIYLHRQQQTPGGGETAGPAAAPLMRVVKTRGLVVITRDGNDYRAEARSVVRPGNIITTNDGAAAEITVGNATRLTLMPTSRLRVGRPDTATDPAGWPMTLTTGSLQVVQKPGVGVTLVFDAPHAQVTADHATFSLSADKARTSVTAARGPVRLVDKSTGRSISLQDQQTAVAGPNDPVHIASPSSP